MDFLTKKQIIMNKRIAMLAYTTLSTDSRVIREAKAAVEAGYNVDFYTLNEDNKILIDGVTIIYSKRSQYKGRNKIKFILSYVYFFIFCLFNLSCKSFSKCRYRIIHVNNMPNFLVFSTIIAKLSGSAIIMDVHDVMPELFAQKFSMNLDSFLIRLLYFEERCSLKFADIIISVNRSCTERFRANKIRKTPIVEILNAADEEIFSPPESKLFDSEELKLVYPATIALVRNGIDILLDAIDTIVKKKVNNVKLSIFGGGEDSELLKSMIIEKSLSNYVHYSGRFIDFSTLNSELENSSVGIIPFPKGYSTDHQMPIKMHEYFVKKLAVVSSDVKLMKDDFSEIVLLFRAGDPVDLAEKIMLLNDKRELLADYSRKGYEYYKENKWSKYKKVYIELLNSL